MPDSFDQAMAIAVPFTAVWLSLLWNFRWKRTMGLWLHPPYRPVTEYAFRAFFGLNLIGACIVLVDQLRLHPLTRQTFGPTVAAALILFVVVAVAYRLALWFKGQSAA